MKHETPHTPPIGRMFKGTTGTVFVLLCLMYFIEYIDRTNLSVAAPLIKSELHLSNTELGLALGAFGWSYAAFQFLGGFAGDRFGARATLSVLGVIWAVGTCLTGVTGGLGGLIVARAMVGMGEAGTLPTGARVVTSWVPVVRRGFAQGFLHAAARFAAACTPPIVVALIPFVGWRGAFVVLGMLSLVWTCTWFFYFRNDPRHHSGVTKEEIAMLPDYAPHRQPLSEVPWTRLIKRTLPVTLVFFCHAWTLWLYLSWLPSFFSQSYHLNLKHTALFSSGVFLAGMVGDAAGGLLTDFILRRTGNIVKARRNAVIVAFSCSFICLGGVLLLHGITRVTAALAFALFFLEMAEAPIWATPSDIAPRYVGFSSGIMSTAAGLAATLSPVTFGWLTDVTGSLRVPFVLSIALLFIGVLLSFTMRPDLKVEADSPAISSSTAEIEVT